MVRIRDEWNIFNDRIMETSMNPLLDKFKSYVDENKLKLEGVNRDIAEVESLFRQCDWLYGKEVRFKKDGFALQIDQRGDIEIVFPQKTYALASSPMTIKIMGHQKLSEMIKSLMKGNEK